MTTHCLAHRFSGDGIHLAQRVTQEVRRTGKHFLPQPLLERLSAFRACPSTSGSPFVRAFLDCVLDKHDGVYWNRTYLALPVLELVLEGAGGAPDPEGLATLLIADAARFEITAAVAGGDRSDGDPPDPAVLRKRLRHALRFAAPDLADAAGSSRAQWRGIADALPRPPATEAGRWFDVTVQPVYVLHDEYFFIRVLQTHEMLFTAIAREVGSAVGALRDGRPAGAAEHVDRAACLFSRASALFRLVATMRPGHFSSFRRFTQGASAIQSEQYKRFEVLCGTPPAARLASAAFADLPAVRAEAEDAGRDTLTRAYLDLRRGSGIDSREWGLLHGAVGRLEDRHQRWKTAHRSIAARMLGGASGSGHTDGVPYLDGCLRNRLFWQLGQAAA
ncbi:tryptophan 2,3-dioxygenase family protein [Streptomyces sp. 2P-4]|uniref:tryptophan 2,3-dioxygenase family protein n=1 Tax=Streptomyces sp. 2P-4 TaxID=2931974 RepID=UPI0025417541|nr:tryptophan 2,3-dioxygenase family protein [Streptomyces sp. 2P-4]